MRIETSGGVPIARGSPGSDIRLADVLAVVPPEFRRRGFFFRPLVAALGPHYERKQEELEEPPALGIYRPLVSYPTRDYFRLFDTVARMRSPRVSPAQAYRLLARDEPQSFKATVLGQLTWGLFDEPTQVLLAWPEVLGKIMRGPETRVQQRGERHVHVEVLGPFSSPFYGLGVLEGCVLAFAVHPRITLETHEDRTSYDVRWDV